jgi:hypothetical protein
VHEIKSALILQPGPAALTDGLAELERIVARWAARPLRHLPDDADRVQTPAVARERRLENP